MQTSNSVEIDLDLYNKLLKCGIFRANPKTKTIHERKKVMLDMETQGLYENGYALGRYLLILKDLLVILTILNTLTLRNKTIKNCM